VRRRLKNGTYQIVPFMLKDRPAEMFLEHFVQKWREAYPGRHIPNSELVEEYLDPGAWKERVATGVPLVGVEPNPVGRPWMDDLDWRNDFDKRHGNGTFTQEYEEQLRREYEDDKYFEQLFGSEKDGYAQSAG
jgi:hypothetical protein